MTTYEDLVDATLAHGLMPLVVPQLKTITLGGAVTGLGIESSSFRNGLPHESVLEMEVLTGDGRVVDRAARQRARRPVPRLPQLLRHARLRAAAEDRARAGPAVRAPAPPALRRPARRSSPRWRETRRGADFVDGTVFGPRRDVPDARHASPTSAPAVSDYTGMGIYYRSLQQRETDHLTVRDYLWRWDTDWFWCSRAFGVQNPRVRRLVPKRLLRSDSYWKLVALERRYGPMRRHRPPARPARAGARGAGHRGAGRPGGRVLRLHGRGDPDPARSGSARCACATRRGWDLYALEPDTTYVNFGFWSTRAARAPARPTARTTAASSEVVERARRAQVAVLDLLLRPRASSGSCTTGRCTAS